MELCLVKVPRCKRSFITRDKLSTYVRRSDSVDSGFRGPISIWSAVSGINTYIRDDLLHIDVVS